MESRQCVPGGHFLTGDTDPRQPFVPEEFRPEDRLIADTALNFMRRDVMPFVDRIEQGDHVLMRDLMRKAGEIGLLGVDVPELYGGLGLAYLPPRSWPRQSMCSSRLPSRTRRIRSSPHCRSSSSVRRNRRCATSRSWLPANGWAPLR